MLMLMGDPAGELAESSGMKLTHPGPAGKGLLGRCKRHVVYAVNGVIKAVHVSENEDDPAGDKDPSFTLAPAILEAIAASK
jgi:peroxiredoxin